MSSLSYIIWNVDPVFFYIPYFDRPVRYYGVLFAIGFLISQQILFYIYHREGKPERDVETLTIYMVIATIIGARLGHVLFYEPEKYFSHPIDILKIWEGGLASHGAAFGILFALWIYVNYYIKIDLNPFEKPEKRFVLRKQKRKNQSYLQVVDRMVIVVALTGCLIRFGNFMNSEIYGKPTHSNYGVVFTDHLNEAFQRPSSPVEKITYDKDEKRKPAEPGYVPIKINIKFKIHPDLTSKKGVATYLEGTFRKKIQNWDYLTDHIYQPASSSLDYTISQNKDRTFSAVVNTFGVVRHPTQLYESFTSLSIFILLLALWYKYKNKTPPGLLLGLFLIILFGLRFVHELFKENQVAFEDDLNFNMGQILSIPLIIAGVFILIRAINKVRYTED